MAIVKPFKGIRPPKEIAPTLASLPYDVMNSEEATAMAEGKPESLLHITRAEICFDGDIDPHAPEVYDRAVSNFTAFLKNGFLLPDDEPHFYIYAQTMNGRTQYGIVGAAACEDYDRGVILKHELTRPDKEEDRRVLTRKLNANIEPVFFTYRAVPELDEIVEHITKEQEPEYDFVAGDGIGHHFWVIRDAGVNEKIERLFRDKVPNTYVADGHHRTAAAAGIGRERKAQNPGHTGEEAYNYFMAVHFPDHQLQIIDYNRVVKDLNGLSPGEFLDGLSAHFQLEKTGGQTAKPEALHTFGMYLEGEWYRLRAKEHTYDDDDPIGSLDVSILSNFVLDPLLGIKDLRRDTRIEFVGGIRGLDELKRRVDSGEMKVAFALYPVSMEQLMRIADTGNIMPPKVTWFEPKLRSGLVIYSLSGNI